MLVRALERSRIDRDRVVQQSTERGRNVRIDLLDVARKVESSLAGLRRARLLLALLLGVRIVVCVRASCVLSEMVRKLEVHSDRARDDRHLVLSESARLVRADDRRIGHRLTGAKYSHQERLLRHATGSERERERDGEG